MTRRAPRPNTAVRQEEPWYGPGSFRQLPARHWLAMPEPAREPRFGRWPSTQYEFLVAGLQMRGMAVPGHPAACTTDGCGHPVTWHAHGTRDHACVIDGCACRKLARADLAQFPSEVAR